jgi:hypothetical protein
MVAPITSIPPISGPAVALRIEAIGAIEGDLLAVVEAAQSQTAATPDAKATPPAPAPVNPVKQAVDAAKADAAGRQASLAPLFADLAEAHDAPDLPAKVKAAIGQLLALRTPLTGPITAETVKQAVAQSGLFLEARLADRAPASEGAPPDLKAALLTLQRALAATPAANAAPGARPTTTPPPVRDAALMAQAPALAALSAGDSAAAILQHLRPEVDQAVARQLLHQLASLPDGGAMGWMFELPVATPQGTGVAQFEIDRDGAQPGEGGAAEAWRVRFSIDLEPLGPVHVHLRMEGERAQVAIWAERGDGLERLREQGAELAQALPADVVFRPGAPRRPVPQSGRFVDRTS